MAMISQYDCGLDFSMGRSLDHPSGPNKIPRIISSESGEQKKERKKRKKAEGRKGSVGEAGQMSKSEIGTM